MISEWRQLANPLDRGQPRRSFPSGGGLHMGVCSRSHGGCSVVDRRSGVCDGGAIDLLHRFQFGTSLRMPLVCGTAVGLEAMASTRRERGATRLALVRVIGVGMNGL